jgi:hypothetical protein
MSKGTSKQQWTTQVKPADVLYGRGSGPNQHEGNIRFRELVADRKEEYTLATCRHDKAVIAGKIVQEVHKRKGRFLRKAEAQDMKHIKTPKGFSGPVYCIIDDTAKLEKTKQALRECPKKKPVQAKKAPPKTGPLLPKKTKPAAKSLASSKAKAGAKKIASTGPDKDDTKSNRKKSPTDPIPEKQYVRYVSKQNERDARSLVALTGPARDEEKYQQQLARSREYQRQKRARLKEPGNERAREEQVERERECRKRRLAFLKQPGNEHLLQEFRKEQRERQDKAKRARRGSVYEQESETESSDSSMERTVKSNPSIMETEPATVRYYSQPFGTVIGGPVSGLHALMLAADQVTQNQGL